MARSVKPSAAPGVTFECPACYGWLRVQLTADSGEILDDRCICRESETTMATREDRIIDEARRRLPPVMPGNVSP